MKQARLRHVGIKIKDWKKIRPFYESLGFKVIYEKREEWLDIKITIRKMRNKNGDILEFVPYVWFPHIALTVDKLPDQDMAICKFNKKVQVVFMQDPEGNWIEFVKEL